MKELKSAIMAVRQKALERIYDTHNAGREQQLESPRSESRRESAYWFEMKTAALVVSQIVLTL